MKYFKKLIGKNIYLSPMSSEDAETYTKWMNDLSTTDGLGGSARMVSLEGEKEWLSQAGGQYLFAIVSQDGDQLLGNCGIESIDYIHKTAEIGIFIGDEENRNKGYGTEVMNLLIEYGFNYLNLNNLMLRVFSFNERAIACYKKAGFNEIGRRRQSYYLKGTYYDQVYMDIIKEDI